MGKCGENIRQRADGRWEARVVQGVPMNGRTNYKYLYGKTRQEAGQKKLDFVRTLLPQEGITEDGKPLSEAMIDRNEASDREIAAKSGEPMGNTISLAASKEQAKRAVEPIALATHKDAPQGSETLTKTWNTIEDVAANWLASKKTAVKESTHAYYRTMVKNHITSVIGDTYVKDFSSEALSDFLTNRKKYGRVRDGAPLADKTVADLKSILKQILTFAQVRGLLASTPVCPTATVKQPPISVLSKAEQSKVENTLREEDKPFSLGVLLSLYGGPRIGEVCALKWEDFDFENETVRISKTVMRISNPDYTDGTLDSRTKVVITSPKTENSARTIPLPSQIFAYFKERRKEGSMYVVTGTEKYMEPRVCRERYMRLLSRAGVAAHTYHCLRHTFATRCIENGVDFKSLSEMMGHSDVKITMQRYVHPSMDFKKEQVNKLPCFLASGQ